MGDTNIQVINQDHSIEEPLHVQTVKMLTPAFERENNNSTFKVWRF